MLSDASNKKKKKVVRFSGVVTVLAIPLEDRHGDWHLYAIDRERFRRRCTSFEALMEPVIATALERQRTRYDNGYNNQMYLQ